MLRVVQAFDRALIEEIAPHGAADLERMLSAAHAAYRDRAGWLKPHQRLAVLEKLCGLMAPRIDELALLIAREGGKPLTDARTEALRALDGVKDAMAHLRTDRGHEIPMGLSPAADGRLAFTIREPIGVVAAISAFNHPLNLIVHQVVPAIATGCPVIVKPASTTPLSCRELVRMVHEAGLPEPWCQMFLPDGNELAEALVTDPRIAFFSFIGSAKVGWSLKTKLAPGTRSALEHGGVAPLIVDESADLDRLIEPLAKGGYYHAGQVCVSTQRIYVHRSLKDDLLERFTKRVAALRVGDAILAETEVGPLIQPGEVERVGAWIDEAVGAKAGLLVGGKRLSETTYAPTILDEPPADAKVSTQEIFGPLTCIYGFDDLGEAIGRANALPVAFQSAIFSQDIDAALKAALAFDASAVMINDHTAFRVDWMPFAGRRVSGYGIGGIPYTMHDMTQEKMIVLKHG